MSNWSGRTIGGYQIAEEIGRGGMTTVYRAYQPQLERNVAVKVLRATETHSREFLTRFRREAKAVAALRHPNILTVYDYGEVEKIAYIVMEYVEGGALEDRLTGQPIEWAEVARLIIPVGRALAYAHSQGIVHRDVKPANILLARPDWPLLADFGLAKLLDPHRRITKPGDAIGTPAYFSPEQAAGEDVDHRSDIYSLGLVLYEMLAGRLPFEADSFLELMLCRLHQPPSPPSRFNDRISSSLEAAILRALACDPAARYPTMEAWVEELSRVPGGAEEPVAPPPPKSDTTARLAKRAFSAGPRLVVAETGVTLPLPRQGEVVIGRDDPDAASPPDVDLGSCGGDQAGVSRRHARLLSYPEGWLLEDLHSKNGTFVNDVRLAPGQPTRLRHGDRVRCGCLTMSFCEE